MSGAELHEAWLGPNAALAAELNFYFQYLNEVFSILHSCPVQLHSSQLVSFCSLVGILTIQINQTPHMYHVS